MNSVQVFVPKTLAVLSPNDVQASDEQSGARLQGLYPEGAPAAASGYSPGDPCRGTSRHLRVRPGTERPEG